MTDRDFKGAAEEHIERQKQIAIKINEITTMRELQVMQVHPTITPPAVWVCDECVSQVVFGSWEGEMRNGLDLKRKIRSMATDMQREQERKLMRSVCVVWRDIVTGPSSRRACRIR